MKLTETQYKEKVADLYGDDCEVVGRFKGLSKPILLKYKYGVVLMKPASRIFTNKISISSALNKTSYFMKMLEDTNPGLNLIPESEYENMKSKMLFNTKYGLVSITPDSLMAGHIPNISSALNRKDYFKKNLVSIYNGEYDFKVTSTDRRSDKRSILVCTKHGEQSVDNDYLFQGAGCPVCNKKTVSNCLYVLKLEDDTDTFYKLGVTIKKDGSFRRYIDYSKKGYKLTKIKEIEFEDHLKCKQHELKLIKMIKSDKFNPKNWESKNPRETFKTEESLEKVLEYINNDIV